MSKFDIGSFSNELKEIFSNRDDLENKNENLEEYLKRLWQAYTVLINACIIKWDDPKWLEIFNDRGIRIIYNNGCITAISDTPAAKVFYKENKN